MALDTMAIVILVALGVIAALFVGILVWMALKNERQKQQTMQRFQQPSAIIVEP